MEWGQCKVLYSIYGLSCDKLNVIHIWVHTVFWLFWREVASCCLGTLFLLTEKQFRGWGVLGRLDGVSRWVGRESLQTLIQLLCLPLSFRTTSGHALAAPLGIERPSYLAEDLVSQASNAGPSSHTLRQGWARRGTCIVHFHTLLSEGPP